MSAESDLYATLANNVALNALVDGRIYPDAIPEDADLPAVVFGRESTPPVVTIHGTKVAEFVNFKISAWAEKREQAEEVGDLMAAAMQAEGESPTDRNSGADIETGLYAATLQYEIFSL
jgi:hypothetical protein